MKHQEQQNLDPYSPPELEGEGISPNKASELESSSGQVSPRKVHRKHWLLPLLGYGYIPAVIGLAILLGNGGFDGFTLFISSGAVLLILLPAYAVLIAKLFAERSRQGIHSILLSLYQIFSLVPPAYWIVFVLTFGGSPAWFRRGFERLKRSHQVSRQWAWATKLRAKAWVRSKGWWGLYSRLWQLRSG